MIDVQTWDFNICQCGPVGDDHDHGCELYQPQSVIKCWCLHDADDHGKGGTWESTGCKIQGYYCEGFLTWT